MDSVGPHNQNTSFLRSNEPRAVYEIFGDPEFRPHFCRNFSWTFIKTLVMETMALMAKTTHFQGQMNPGAELSYGASWPSQPKRPIFKVKRSPKQVNPSFYRFSCAIVHGIFGDPEFQPHFCQKFSWTSVKTLVMEPMALMDKTAHFQGQTSPGAGKPLTFVKTLAMEPIGLHIQNGPFLMSNDPQSSYGVSWPSRSKRPIFKVKRSPEKLWSQLALTDKATHFQGQMSLGAGKPPHFTYFRVLYSMDFLVIWNFDLSFTQIFHGCPLRPLLWSQLALMANTTHFQGQTIPGPGKPPILLIFVCYSSPYFLVIQNFDAIFAKKIHGRPLRP
ncbi:hypothetical protein H5410_058877 [Solanum commersonii]|uniref:Uncharacterized protein n=1 Tax=Solanum commersonii TaxID=4109 RepID=A0A9J5W170_SOLCO|nr:hypothetical protein H5410_058877 [Solanum commersonii]